MGERRRKECTATALKGAYVSSPFFSFARASALRLSFAPGARGAGAPLPLPAACAAAEDAALRVALARNGRDEGGKEEEEEKGALPAMVAAAAHALLSSSALSGSRAWRSRAASAAGLACAAVCVSLFGSRCGGALAWVFFFLFSFFSFSALLPRAVPPPPLATYLTCAAFPLCRLFAPDSLLHAQHAQGGHDAPARRPDWPRRLSLCPRQGQREDGQGHQGRPGPWPDHLRQRCWLRVHQEDPRGLDHGEAAWARREKGGGAL